MNITMNKPIKETPFKVGDVVKLPSEDKLMTVESIDDKKVQCVWLKPDLSPEYHDFAAGVLVLVRKESRAVNGIDHTLMEN